MAALKLEELPNKEPWAKAGPHLKFNRGCNLGDDH
jgi:hypothetical protein